MMFKTVLILSLVAVLAFSFAGCHRSAVENTNTVADNTNSAAENPFANITDADQALAEGTRLLDEDQTGLAVEALKQAVKLNPELAEAWFKLGVGYGLLEKAEQQSGDRVPGESDSKVKPNSQKAFEKAVEAYKKWLAANPNDDAGWYNLGRAYAKLGKDEEAEEAFKKAVKLKPNDVDYLVELGNTEIHLAKYHEALDPLKKAVELDPDDPRAADLLDDAEAGRQRLDYVAPNNTNTNKASNSNSNSNSNANTSSNTATNSGPRNTNTAHKPEANTKLPPPANKPKPH